MSEREVHGLCDAFIVRYKRERDAALARVEERDRLLMRARPMVEACADAFPWALPTLADIDSALGVFHSQKEAG